MRRGREACEVARAEMVITLGNLLTSVERSRTLHARLSDHFNELVHVEEMGSAQARVRGMLYALECNAVQNIHMLQKCLKEFSPYVAVPVGNVLSRADVIV